MSVGDSAPDTCFATVQAWVKVMTDADGNQIIEQIVWDQLSMSRAVAMSHHVVPPPQKSPVVTMPPPPGKLGLSSQNLAKRHALGAAGYAAVMAQIDEGGEVCNAALESLFGTVKILSFDKHGCRLVQKAIESAETDVAVSFAHEMKGCIREAARNPHANFVIQRIIEVLPATSTKFIVEELLDCVMEVAQHRTGCRVICRVIEHSHVADTTAELFNRIISGTLVLSRHVFGHYVVQSLLEHGTIEQRHRIAGTLQGCLLQESQNRSSKYVIESAIQFCSPEDKQNMLQEIIGLRDNLMKLVDDENGYYVLRAIVQIFGDGSQTAEMIAQLQKSAAGKRLLDDAKMVPGW